MTQRMKAAALAYLAQGRSVVPVTPGKKHPPLLRWEEYQHRLPTEAEVTEWWTGTPDANIALITGQVSGISVVDIDGDEGKESFLHHLQGDIPQSLIHHTPRGAHMILKYNPGLKQTAGVLPGIDIRNDGGYIIAPPSIVDGKEYTVFRDRKLVALEGVPLALNGTMPQPLQGGSPKWVAQLLEKGSHQGKRNDETARLVGFFHSRNVPKDIIEVQLLEFAAKCTPPFSRRELQQTIESITRYHQRAFEEQITDPPAFRQDGDDYVFDWEKHLVQVRLVEVWHQRDGLSARLEINTTRPGIPSRVHGPVNWKLHSTSGRDTLARYLTKRIDIDWPSILEDTVRLATRTYEEREPAVLLSEVTAVETGYVMHPLLREEEPTIIFGDGGSGKSYISLATAMAVQTGESLLPFSAPAPRGVLYLDWESSAITHRVRMERLALGVGMIDSLPGIAYLRCNLSLSEHLRQIKALISKYGIGCVIIDSAAAAAGGEPEKAEVALRFFNSLRTLKTTSLIVAHTTKDASQGKPFGSSFWHNEARATFEVIRQQDEEASDIDIGLYNRKANDAKLLMPIGLKLRFTKSTTWFEKMDLTEADTKLTSQLPDSVRIEQYLLEENRSTISAIAEALDIRDGTVRTTLNRYRGKKFVRWDDGSKEWSAMSHA
jgi:hypothetical protein